MLDLLPHALAVDMAQTLVLSCEPNLIKIIFVICLPDCLYIVKDQTGLTGLSSTLSYFTLSIWYSTSLTQRYLVYFWYFTKMRYELCSNVLLSVFFIPQPNDFLHWGKLLLRYYYIEYLYPTSFNLYVLFLWFVKQPWKKMKMMRHCQNF